MFYEFYESHPVWSWLTIAIVVLSAEIVTGTGWLLWAAASAGAVAAVALLTRALGLPGEIILFAVLAIGSTLLGRRYLTSKELQPGEDINDRAHSLIGKTGKALSDFEAGEGRVLVDGAEWIARAEGEAPESGGHVQVVNVIGGATLAVKVI